MDSMDVDEPSFPSSIFGSGEPAYFRIALDFGTTRTAVAVMKDGQKDFPPGKGLDIDNDIFMIENYPDTPDGAFIPRQEVPTELWIPPKRSGHADKPNPSSSSSRASSESPNYESEEAGYDSEDVAAVDAAEADKQYGIRWGYGVHDRTTDISIQSNTGQSFSKFKLCLESNPDPDTQNVQQEIKAAIDNLQNPRIVRNHGDLFEIFLARLFQHVYNELVTKYSFNDRCEVEPILCVPVSWKTDASRFMVEKVGKAMKKAGLFAAHHRSAPDFFIISEPEAASTLVLEKTRGLLQPGEAFLLLDAGGGTVDAACYAISNVHPLRMRREAIPQQNSLCGSSYLNTAFQSILTKRLEPKDLRPGAPPINRVIDMAVENFEYRTKRRIQHVQDSMEPRRKIVPVVDVPDVRQCKAKLFKNGCVYLGSADVKDIFTPRLEAVAKLMEEQLQKASAEGIFVRRVILTGGFSASEPLKRYIDERIAGYNSQYGTHIRLECPQIAVRSTSVAHGAIVRAVHKEQGPQRYVRSSYGFLRKEQYNPEKYEGHRQANKQQDPVDGDYYVSTIAWIIKQGSLVDRNYTKTLTMIHTFDPEVPELLCREVLFVADAHMESHWPRNHDKNKIAHREAYIVVDVTFLKTQGLIQLTTAPEGNRRKKRQWYEVELDLVVRMEGRNLVAEAFWRGNRGDNQVLERMQHSIAAAFEYGTE